jgi:hypothetical protein
MALLFINDYSNFYALVEAVKRLFLPEGHENLYQSITTILEENA